MEEDPLPLTVDLLNLESLGFDSAQYYYCAKFQVIVIRGFRFIVLT